MTSEDLKELKDQITQAVSDFYDGIDNMKDALERYTIACNSITATALNTLITFGFVPGAKLKFRGTTYTFVGYTESINMMFKDDQGQDICGGNVEILLKHLAEWTKETKNNEDA